MAAALTATALTTLATLEARLGLSTPADAVKALLRDYINFASDLIERETNRVFGAEAAIEEKVAGYGTAFLRVARTPITTLTSITFNGGAVDSSKYEIHNAKVGTIRNVNGSWTWTAAALANIAGDPLPGTERLLYTITYNGGYVLPQDDPTRDLPYDVEEACIELAKQIYFEGGRDPTVKSEKLLSWSASYKGPADLPGGLPALTARTIRRYTRAR